MIKVLGISGSPRVGNSKYLLEEALKSAKSVGEEVETEYISIRGKKLGGCVMCQACEEDGECIIKDDFQEMSQKWIEADVVIYSVPVYHMGMPAQLKAFLDRLGNSFFGKYSGNFTEGKATLPKSLKVIGSIAQGAHVFSGQEHTLTDLINHALIMGCIPVTGDMWEAYIGAGGWTYNEVGRNSIEEQVKEGRTDALVALRASKSVAKRAVELSILLKNKDNQNLGFVKDNPVYQPYVDRFNK